MSWFWKVAAGLAINPTPTTAPFLPDTTLAVAQRLNYDVISIIFVLSSAEWNTAALTLSSVCRLWRYIAHSMPQIWSRIDLYASTRPYNLHLFLEHSRPLPLPIFVPSIPSDRQLILLPSAVDRITSIKIVDSYRFLLNRFPVLERLELEGQGEREGDYEAHECFSDRSRFRRLRELCLMRASNLILRAIARQNSVFPRLQKLEVICNHLPHWVSIIHSVSSTLVSLHLGVSNHPMLPADPLPLPKLRHLQITTYNLKVRLILKFEAPLLQSIDEGIDSKFGSIRLQDPQSVKYLYTGNFPLDLASYPGLRKLWIHDNTGSTQSMIRSLRDQVHSCPELEAIFYYDHAEYTRMKPGQLYPTRDSIMNGYGFIDIQTLIRETGRNITLQEFLPSEIYLPGSIPWSKSNPESHYK